MCKGIIKCWLDGYSGQLIIAGKSKKAVYRPISHADKVSKIMMHLHSSRGWELRAFLGYAIGMVAEKRTPCQEKR